MNKEENILTYLDGKEKLLSILAKDIWSHPELGLQETYASKLIIEKLKEAGFVIEENVGQMPTAFIASWGEGKPTIGILGEYDALPGLSQKTSTKKEPIKTGDPGHGCGHNLLGIGSLGAVLAVKEAIKNNGIKGTIKYYGCPAEETLIGKIFMAREGIFNDLDAAITWHPMNLNRVWESSCLAMNSFKLNFHGVSAHAAAMPHMGRSALDGVVLTDVGVNYLREHIVQEARIHCVVTNGGLAPNVAPEYAQIWYFVRAPHRNQVEDIYSRILDIAKGAALMSGTSYDVEFITGCYEYIPNSVIGEVMKEKLRKIGAPQYTEQEKKFAQELESTLPATSIENTLRSYGLTREEIGGALCDKIIEKGGFYSKEKILPGSTDVGDVSYITPTAQFMTVGMPFCVPGHSWQSTASHGTSIAFKGMLLAAKTLALTALDLLTKPNILKAAQDEFKKVTDGKKYISPLPKDLKPPIETLE